MRNLGCLSNYTFTSNEYKACVELLSKEDSVHVLQKLVSRELAIL